MGESLTSTGSAMGTIAYMSPEQELDARSDIFSSFSSFSLRSPLCSEAGSAKFRFCFLKSLPTCRTAASLWHHAALGLGWRWEFVLRAVSARFRNESRQVVR